MDREQDGFAVLVDDQQGAGPEAFEVGHHRDAAVSRRESLAEGRPSHFLISVIAQSGPTDGFVQVNWCSGCASS